MDMIWMMMHIIFVYSSSVSCLFFSHAIAVNRIRLQATFVDIVVLCSWFVSPFSLFTPPLRLDPAQLCWHGEYWCINNSNELRKEAGRESGSPAVMSLVLSNAKHSMQTSVSASAAESQQASIARRTTNIVSLAKKVADLIQSAKQTVVLSSVGFLWNLDLDWHKKREPEEKIEKRESSLECLWNSLYN